MDEGRNQGIGGKGTVPLEIVVEPTGNPGREGRVFSPIHPAAATILLFVDNLWMLAEWNALVWLLTVPLSFLSVFVPTLWLQRKSRRDSWGRALGKALVLAIVAAVPTSVTGTPVGMALLAWAGIEARRR